MNMDQDQIVAALDNISSALFQEATGWLGNTGDQKALKHGVKLAKVAQEVEAAANNLRKLY